MDKKYYEIILGNIISKEAIDMLNTYATLGIALVGTEKDAMIKYVNNEVKSGNQNKKDYEVVFSLNGINSLIDYIGGVIASPINNPVKSLDGYTTNGVNNYIRLNFNPSTQGINYSLDNSNISIFVFENQSINDLATIIQASNNISSNRGSFIRQRQPPAINYLNNANSSSTLLGNILLNNSDYSLKRLTNVSQILNINGIDIDTKISNSTSIPISSFYFGCGYGSSPLRYINSTCSIISFGGAIGFNSLKHHNNKRNLLIELGLTI